MSFGRFLRTTLMLLFLIPDILIILFAGSSGPFLQGIFVLLFILLIFSVGFWFLVSWIFANLFGYPLLYYSLKAEGSSLFKLQSYSVLLTTLIEEPAKQNKNSVKNPCLLMPEAYTTRSRGIVDILDRSFFQTTLIIGVVSVWLMFLDFLSPAIDLLSIGSLLANLPIFMLSPALASIIVVPIWLVNDTRARIYHRKTGEIRRIGESVKNVLNAVAGFGAILRIVISLFGDPVTLLAWALIFVLVPFPVTATMGIYLTQFHPKKVAKVEERLEERWVRKEVKQDKGVNLS